MLGAIRTAGYEQIRIPSRYSFMPIPVSCTCGKRFSAPDNLAGKKEKCANCGSVLAIPAAQQPAAAKPAAKPAAPAAPPIPVECVCGKSYKAPAHLAGKELKCPGCGSSIFVPDPNAKYLFTDEELGIVP